MEAWDGINPRDVQADMDGAAPVHLAAYGETPPWSRHFPQHVSPRLACMQVLTRLSWRPSHVLRWHLVRVKVRPHMCRMHFCAGMSPLHRSLLRQACTHLTLHHLACPTTSCAPPHHNMCLIVCMNHSQSYIPPYHATSHEGIPTYEPTRFQRTPSRGIAVFPVPPPLTRPLYAG